MLSTHIVTLSEAKDLRFADAQERTAGLRLAALAHNGSVFYKESFKCRPLRSL